MGNITADINVGTAPYSIVVRKQGETAGNRCTGDCTSFPVTFTHDEGPGNYYVIVLDSTGCVFDSRFNSGGIGAINCDISAPSFNYEFTPISCSGEDLVNGSVRIFNIVNATRYRLCLGSYTYNCTNCTTSTGTLTPGVDTIISIPPSTPNTNSDFSVRIYNGAGCEMYADINGSIYTPVCGVVNTPDFSVALVQPSCSLVSGGVIQNAVIKLSNITNATRYKLCYNSTTFNSVCQSDCSNSDGVITSSTKDIEIIPPAEGQSQNITLRVYNGNTCNFYKDYSFSIYSQKCNTNEVSMMTMDLQVFQNANFAKCDQSNTYQVEYDFYITPNTPGMSENGQKARTSSGFERTVPNTNDVPNTFIAAGFKPICANGVAPGVGIGNIFYRHAWNMSLLKAKYPNINEFIFDVYANKTKDTGESTFSNSIRPYINAFTGVAMIKQLYSNNSNDAYRNPLYAGYPCSNQSCPDPNDIFTNNTTTMPDVIYKTSVSGNRKIATIKYNYTTNKVTWTEIPQ